MTSSISVGYFSPSSLNGCVLWLDASSLALANGATVSTWPSLGPVSYTTTSTAGRFPTYASNVRNGLGCVQYATGQTSILSNFALPATQSIFLLYYPINTSAGSPFIEQGPDVNGNDGFFFHAQNNNNYAIRNGGALGTVNFGTIAQANTWQMIEGMNKDPNANNTMSFYSNATLIASNGVQNGTATVTNTLFINGRNNTNTLSYPSYIAELIIYNTPLNNFGRQQVEGYLAWKWGLTSLLPATHPYKTFPYLTITESVPRAIPTNAFILPINTFSTIKTFSLPAASSFPGRMLVLKDYLGYAGSNNIRLSTSGVDTIERSNVSSMTLSNNYGAWWFNNDGLTKWYLTSAYLNTLTIVQPIPPLSNGLWVKSYANTGQQPNSNGPATFSGSSSNWGALLNTTFVGNIFASSNTPGPTNYMYYGNNYGIYPSGNTNYSLIVGGFLYSAAGGTIQFRIVTDDGFRLDYNNTNAILSWQGQGATTYTSAVLSMPAGYTPITMRWYDGGGGGAAIMEYNMNGAGYTSNGTNVYFYGTSNVTQT